MRANGFALLDVLVATGIIMAATAALAALMTASARAERDARAASLATLLAADKMEELQTGPVGDGDGTEQLNASGEIASGSTVADAGPVFCRWSSVSSLSDAGSSPAVIQVDVAPCSPAAAADASGGSRLMSITRAFAP